MANLLFFSPFSYKTKIDEEGAGILREWVTDIKTMNDQVKTELASANAARPSAARVNDLPRRDRLVQASTVMLTDR